ncbi:hypothetical protein, partial [Streptococcus pneumoniae]
FIIDLMGLFFYTKIGSIISIGDLPTTNIIEPFFYPKSAVGREIGSFGKEVQFLFSDWGKIVVIR